MMDQRYCFRLATVAVESSSAQFSTGTGLYSRDESIQYAGTVHWYRTVDSYRGILYCTVYTGTGLYTVHSWAQRKLSLLGPLNPLNILVSINGPLLSLGFNGLNN